MIRELQVPSPYYCIENPDFQNWLIKVGIMTIVDMPVEERGLGLKPGVSLTPMEAETVQGLATNDRRILSNRLLARRRYNGWAGESEMNALGNHFSRLNNKFEEGYKIKAFTGLGRSIGVLGCTVPFEEMPLLFFFSQNIGMPFTAKELAERVTGFGDDAEIHCINASVYRHKRLYLPGTAVSIINIGNHARAFYMMDLRTKRVS